MVFEIIEKGLRGFPIGNEMISISKTSLSIGRTIADELLENGFVEIWLDRETNKVGFKSTKDSVRGFKVHIRKGKTLPCISSKLAFNLLPVGLYDAVKEEDMWVIKVLEIARK